MNTFHICSACRRSILANLRSDGIRQRHFKRTLDSISGIRTVTDGVPEYRLPNRLLASEDNSPRKNRPKGSRTRYNDRLEVLFEEARRSPSTTTSPPRSTLGPRNELWKDVETLGELVQSETETVDKPWRFFVLNLGPNAWTQEGTRIEIPAQFQVIAGELRRAVRTARQQSHDLTNLPTVTEILTIYASLGMHSQVQWNHLVFDLLRKLSQHVRGASRAQGSRRGELQDGTGPQLVTQMAADLLTAWKFLGHYWCSAPGSLHMTKDLDWSFLPQELPDKLVAKASTKGWLEVAFLAIFPYLPKQNAKSITSAALTTFALLTDRSVSMIHPEWWKIPLIQLFGKIIQHIRRGMPLREMKDLIAYQVAANAVRDIEIDWLYVLNEAGRTARFSAKQDYSVFRPLELSYNNLKKDAGKALAKNNAPWMDLLWKSAKSYSEIGKPPNGQQDHPSSALAIDNTVRDKNIRLTKELHETFIHAYMGLRKPDQAIEVWHHLVKCSIQPSSSTWVAMIDGCKMARSADALEAVWKKLIASGDQPDISCWTARISGLFECGMTKVGMQALNEMGKIWAEAARLRSGSEIHGAGDIGKIVKPTTATINAAISGLLNQGMSDKAYKVLSWGTSLGILPNMVTFNCLIQASVRQGRNHDIPALLRQMREQGLQANFATFKTLLELILGDKGSSQTPVEQIELINDILKTMEAAGQQPNYDIYSKIIVVLLKSNSSDLTAVNTILDRMEGHNLYPSSQIYTMIVMRLFGCSPPNLQAVHILLDRIKLSGSTTAMDNVFWDRIIHGFARAKDTTSAMQIIDQLHLLPRRIEVGWQALDVLVQALVENGERELARRVVGDVRLHREVEPQPTERGQFGQHAFWETVRVLEVDVAGRTEE